MAQVIVWFRRDLRLTDNPALRAALECKQSILPLFIWSPEDETPWDPGSASRWWLHQSLKSLKQDLEKRGSLLIIRKGPAIKTLFNLIRGTKAKAVFWNRCHEPKILERDRNIEESLKKKGIEVRYFNSSLLFEPGTIKTKTGGPFQVFTPFWKGCLDQPEPPPPFPSPKRIFTDKNKISSLKLEDLKLEPKTDWTGGMREAWQPGEEGAAKQLKRFLGHALRSYSTGRDRPDERGTSRLSPHLHFGEIGPRQIWQAVNKQDGGGPFLRQLLWREFAHHLLYHFPHTTDHPLRMNFSQFPWRKDRKGLKSWQKGMTGYPIVDAGMRELWTTGWMHNRVRMIVASFLVKDLLIPWQDGARWFWDTLVDADLANNTLGWQWVAGCGADAAPFFRIFNPVSQGEKFDPQGHYVRRWVPEIARLPNSWLHRPWEAPSEILKKAGIRLGLPYPPPLVDHSQARERALKAFQNKTR